MSGLALHATGINHRYGKQQALIDIAMQQGLMPRRLSLDELFVDPDAL